MPGKTVGTRYTTLRPSCPAGTLTTAPVVTDVNVGNVIWRELEVVIPRGHHGLTGIALSYATQRIIPFQDTDDYLSGDDDDDVYPIELEVSSDIVITTYNTDIYPHAWLLRFKVVDFSVPLALAPQPIPLEQLQAS